MKKEEDTFEKVVRSVMKKFRHFVKELVRGEGNEVVKNAGG